MKKSSHINLLRSTALVVSLVGALWSLSLTLQTGRNNDSILLKILFVMWVLSPYIILLATFMLSKGWLHLRQITLYLLMILLSVGSLMFYSGVLSLPNNKPAFVFLIIPLISWLLIAIILSMTAFFSRTLTRMKDDI